MSETTIEPIGIFNDEAPDVTPPLNLYIETDKATWVRPAASDTIGLATYILTDSTTAAVQRPVRIVDKRPTGVASKVRISVQPITGALGAVYVLTAEELSSIGLTGAVPFVPYGHFLSMAATQGAPLELVTTEELYAVCVAAAVGAGALISVCSEIYFAD